jgi:hypothetical protein
MLDHNYATGIITCETTKENVACINYREGKFDVIPTHPKLNNVKPKAFLKLAAGEYWLLAMFIEYCQD